MLNAKNTIEKHKHEEPKICGHKKLKYCDVCDVVYCEECGKEWGGEANTWIWTDGVNGCDSGTTSNVGIVSWHYLHT